MKRYEDIQKLSQAAYVFLKNFDPEKTEDGRYELGDGVFAIVKTYTTKPRREGAYEAHRKYADIQYMIHGKELIGTEPLEVMHQQTCTQAYDAEKDVEFYANNFEGTDQLLTDGEYRILMPEDGHMPDICVNEPAQVRKIVIKVPVSGENV